jgi:hypothetical protein
VVRARAAGPQDSASMCRLCSRTAVTATSVSGDREGKQSGDTDFRCIVAHEGERGGTHGGGSICAVRNRMRHARQTWVRGHYGQADGVPRCTARMRSAAHWS